MTEVDDWILPEQPAAAAAADDWIVPGAPGVEPRSRLGLNIEEGFRGTLVGEAAERVRSGQTAGFAANEVDAAIAAAVDGFAPENINGVVSPYGGLPVAHLVEMRDRARAMEASRRDTFQNQTLPQRAAEAATVPAWNSGDVVDQVVQGATALLGQVIGGMGSPESFVGPAGARLARGAGETMSGFARRQAAESVAPNAAAGAAVDPLVQTGEVGRGQRAEYDPAGTAGAAALGGAIGGTIPGLGEALSRVLRLRRPQPGPIDPATLTPEEVAVAWADPDVQRIAAANGITDPADPRVALLQPRVEAVRLAEAQRGAPSPVLAEDGSGPLQPPMPPEQVPARPGPDAPRPVAATGEVFAPDSQPEIDIGAQRAAELLAAERANTEAAFRLARLQADRTGEPGVRDPQPGAETVPENATPRMQQDFAERARSPRDPELPRDAGPGRPAQEPPQTFRYTGPDPNTEFPGATSGPDRGGPTQGRTPFPDQGEVVPPARMSDPAAGPPPRQPGPIIDGDPLDGGRAVSPDVARIEQQIGRLTARGEPAAGTPAAAQVGRLRERLARVEGPPARLALPAPQRALPAPENPSRPVESVDSVRGKADVAVSTGNRIRNMQPQTEAGAGQPARAPYAPGPLRPNDPLSVADYRIATARDELYRVSRLVAEKEAEADAQNRARGGRYASQDRRNAVVGEMYAQRKTAADALKAAEDARRAMLAEDDARVRAEAARDPDPLPRAPEYNDGKPVPFPARKPVPQGGPPAKRLTSAQKGAAERAKVESIAAVRAEADRLRAMEDARGPRPEKAWFAHNDEGRAARAAHDAAVKAYDELPPIRGETVTRTSRGRETRFRFEQDSLYAPDKKNPRLSRFERDVSASEQAANRAAAMEKLPAAAFYSTPFDPALAKRLLIDPAMGALRSLRDALKGSAGWIGQTAPNVRAAWQLGADSARATLRSMATKYADPKVRELVDALATNPGSGDRIRGTFQAEVEARSKSMGNRLRTLLQPIVEDAAALGRVRDILTGVSAKGATQSDRDVARRVRTLLDEHHTWLSKRLGSVEKELGYVRGRYFPRQYNAEAIAADIAGFTADARALYRRMGLDGDAAESAANDWANRVMGVGGRGAGDFGHSPSSSYSKGRSLPAESDQIMAKWLVTDPHRALTDYFHTSTRHAEFVSRFGKNAEKVEAALEAMRKGGASPDELTVMRSAFEHATGTMKRDISQIGAGWTGWLQMHGVLALLPRAVFASLAESVSVGMRAGDLRKSFTATADALYQAITPERWQSKSAQEQRAFAEMIGAVSDSFLDASMLARADGLSLSHQQQRVVAGMMNLTMQQRVFVAQRTASSRVAETFVRQMLREVAEGARTQASARRALRELGLDDTQATAMSKWLEGHNGRPPYAELLADTEMANSYRTAVNRFLSESVLSPEAVDKPVYSSTTTGRLAYSVMSFQYAFTRNVLIRSLKEGAEGLVGSGYTAEDRIRLLTPLAGMLLLAGGQYATGQARDALFARNTRREQDDWTKTLLAIDRSGMFGNMSPVVNMVTSAKYERDPSSLLSGAYLGSLLGNIGRMTTQMLPGPMGPNSRNTNNAEWQATRGAWNAIVAPAVVGTLAVAPVPAWARPIAGAAAMFAGAPDTGRAVADAVAGPRTVRQRTAGGGARSGGGGISSSRGISAGGGISGR